MFQIIKEKTEIRAGINIILIIPEKKYNLGDIQDLKDAQKINTMEANQHETFNLPESILHLRNHLARRHFRSSIKNSFFQIQH